MTKLTVEEILAIEPYVRIGEIAPDGSYFTQTIPYLADAQAIIREQQAELKIQDEANDILTRHLKEAQAELTALKGAVVVLEDGAVVGQVNDLYYSIPDGVAFNLTQELVENWKNKPAGAIIQRNGKPVIYQSQLKAGKE